MRSKLFVPASRPELFAKAEASAADALSFDLEDAVAEDKKDEARAILAKYLAGRPAGKGVVVRVNGMDTPHFEADVAAIAAAGVDMINLPKAEDPAQIVHLAGLIGRAAPRPGTRILVNIESPRGLRRAAELAGAHESVAGLQIGFADLLDAHGIDRRDERALSFVRMSVVFAAAEANVAAYDSAFGAVKDVDGFRNECLSARALSFAGKSCIHPSQIAIANETFMPTAEEIARARKLVDAAERHQGVGAFLVDGQMIDKPFLLRARDILALAERAGA